MNIHTILNKLLLTFITLIVANTIIFSFVSAAGISIDAGLTPAENRWILRSQVRGMQRDNDPTAQSRKTKTYIFPVVVAYGLRPDLTVLIRHSVMRIEKTTQGNSSTNSGLSDLFLMGKYRLLRINGRGYTLGVAPTLGLDIPTGKDGFTSNSWDLQTGLFVSGRLRSLNLDLNLTYSWNGMINTKGADRDLGDEYTVEGAFAYQLPFGEHAHYALAPVLETIYKRTTADTRAGIDLANTGESLFLLSPGLKITRGSFILEGLIQFPVWQDQNGLQTQNATNFLVGFRLMN